MKTDNSFKAIRYSLINRRTDGLYKCIERIESLMRFSFKRFMFNFRFPSADTIAFRRFHEKRDSEVFSKWLLTVFLKTLRVLVDVLIVIERVLISQLTKQLYERPPLLKSRHIVDINLTQRLLPTPILASA